MQLDWTRLELLPEEHRFYDHGSHADNLLRPLVSLFFKLKIKADFLWLVSGGCSLLSGFFFLCYDVFLGFSFLLLKLVFFHAGNTLALLAKSSPILPRRYLNGILEFVGTTFVIYCLAQVAFPLFPEIFFLLLWLSIFLQHAYYEYFISHYFTGLEIERHEIQREPDGKYAKFKWFQYLKKAYGFFHNWQVRAIYRIDLWMRGPEPPTNWYLDKDLLSKQTLFRRGYQLLILCALCTLAGVLFGCVLYLLTTNAYWVFLILKRKKKFRR